MYRPCMLRTTKTMVKELKEDLNKWRDILCPWTGRLKILKMSILPKLIDSLITNPIKIPAKIFVDIGQIILKLI